MFTQMPLPTLPKPEIAPTPRTEIARYGPSTLYRFVPPETAPPATKVPLLIVPSMINRWYVVDLREGASLVASLVEQGIDVFCLDWGTPGDEDRYLSWDDVLLRLRRAVRRVARETGSHRVSLLGYCMGGTLSAIHTALEPERIAALVNLLGPIDFSEAGFLGCAVDGRWFDADAIADAGNVSPRQMQSGFIALRPTTQVAKWVRFLERAGDPEARDAFFALEGWASDNIPFPGEAYRTYISSLYQRNDLALGRHRARGRSVDLGAIRCPILSITASADAICPPRAAAALVDLAASEDTHVLEVPGGHVGAVVGSRAARELYPKLGAWLRRRLAPVRAVSDHD